jgi:glycosyltransferase involved in cell wall biosynthesis
MARRFERSVVHRAHRVVATTNRLRDLLAGRYPEEPGRKFVAIPNGYDESDFASAGPAERRAPKEFLVVHAGSINAAFRDPRPLFEAIRQAGDAGLVDPARLRLRFLGGGPFGDSAEMRQAIEKTKLTGRVEFLPRVPYGAALSELTNADLLLLLQASRDTVDLVPAKLFEYLRAGRPVLALAGVGATAEVLKEVGGGWVVDPADGAGLRTAIRAAYEAWTNGSLRARTANPAILPKFTRERLTTQLVAEFDMVMLESLIESGSYEPAF